MTCVIGLKTKDRIYMGADSAGIREWELTIRHDPKVFVNGEFLIGFAWSWRMGDLLRYRLIVPDHPSGMSTSRYMRTHWIDAVRNCFHHGGFQKAESHREEGGDFMVGYRGNLYTVGSDYQVGESTRPFEAAGCGAEIARGAMEICIRNRREARTSIRQALMASEQFCAGVRRPFRIRSIKRSAR